MNIVVGAKAMSMAADYPVIRRLLASAAEERRHDDVGEALKVRAQGAEPLDRDLDFVKAWTAWKRVRRLNKEIEEAWSALQPLLQSDQDPSDHELERLKGEIAGLALEWQTLVGAEHPIGRLIRAASLD